MSMGVSVGSGTSAALELGRLLYLDKIQLHISPIPIASPPIPTQPQPFSSRLNLRRLSLKPSRGDKSNGGTFPTTPCGSAIGDPATISFWRPRTGDMDPLVLGLLLPPPSSSSMASQAQK